MDLPKEQVRVFRLDGTVEGKISREKAHSDFNQLELLHEHIVGFIFDYSARVPETIIITRTIKKKENGEYICDNAGLIEIKVGGHGFSNSSYDDLTREIWEELGISQEKMTQMGYQDLHFNLNHNTQSFIDSLRDRLLLCEFASVPYVSARQIRTNDNGGIKIIREPLIMRMSVGVMGPECKFEKNGGLIKIAQETKKPVYEELDEVQKVRTDSLIADMREQSKKYTHDAIEFSFALEDIYKNNLANFNRTQVKENLMKLCQNSFDGMDIKNKFEPLSLCNFYFTQ